MRPRMQARPTRCALLSRRPRPRRTHGPRPARPAARRARARASRAPRAVRRRRRRQQGACARLGPRRRWRRRRGCRRRVRVARVHERRRDDHAEAAAGWREWQPFVLTAANEASRQHCWCRRLVALVTAAAVASCNKLKLLTAHVEQAAQLCLCDCAHPCMSTRGTARIVRSCVLVRSAVEPRIELYQQRMATVLTVACASDHRVTQLNQPARDARARLRRSGAC